MQLALTALLIVVIGLLVMRAVSRERKEYGRFKRLRATAARKKVYRRWLRESFFVFGGLTAAILLAAWQFVPQVLADAQSWGPLASAIEVMDTTGGRWGVAVAALLFVVALLLPALLLRGNHEDVPTIGDIGALLPRNRGELIYGALLGTNAGIVEELLFRFALPALIFGIVADGVLAFGASAVLFGVLHLYQGPAGVTSSIVLGVIFSLIYILSGSLLLVVVLHVLFDLRSLLLIPVVVMRVHTKTA
ncbi:MAG TPA: CPBP family intramembrane glutamic endopeptidase [Glaciihabitans sp.]|nr:CPBP family intramembrane glutamic endopeptidase [Glaciihabitans sp.]